MQTKEFLLILLLSLKAILFCQAQSVTVYGVVKDHQTGEYLIGATVRDTVNQKGATTNAYGFFSLTTDTPYGIKVSYVGYAPATLDAGTALPATVTLRANNVLRELVVTQPEPAEQELGTVKVSMERLRQLPTLLGEVDVLKSLTTYAGVSAGMEGSAGIFVRGGTPDQNLILLDDVPVYNATHLGGFFSAFNPAAIKSIELSKAYFSPAYGGRLASVIDLKTRDGNRDAFKGELNLGIINQGLTLEGPFAQKKGSFIVSSRVSTLGLSQLLNFSRNRSTGEQVTYNFYDVNAKVNYRFNSEHQLYLSFFTGDDRFKYKEWSNRGAENFYERLLGNYWGNTTATLRYNRVFSEKLFGQFSLIYSRYRSSLENRYEDSEDRLRRITRADVADAGAKFILEYYPTDRLELKAGADVMRQRFDPFVVEDNYGSDPPVRRPLQGLQGNVFWAGSYRLNRFASLQGGLRLSYYRIQNRAFVNPEPRMGLHVALTSKDKVYAAYGRMSQYLHLLSNSTAGLGFDSWVPATALASPSQADQFSLGYSRSFAGGYRLSLEAYLKRMRDLIDYPEGHDFTSLYADSWDSFVSKRGTGRAKGVEGMLHKETGRLTGSLAYTLSKSERRFDEINEGSWFPMKYDRRHQLVASALYGLSGKWKASAQFTFQTGHAVSVPQTLYFNDYPESRQPVFVYEERFNARMPDYHRLDLGLTREFTSRRGSARQLSFGVYNAYNRANPLYLDYKSRFDENGFAEIQVKQYSLFPILPYINYSIKF